MSTEIKDLTTVKEVSADEINALFDIGGDVAMLPAEEKRPNVLSNVSPDTTFLDNPIKDDDNDDNLDSVLKKPVIPLLAATIDAVLEIPNDNSQALVDNEEDDLEKNKGGRPGALVAAAKKLIEKKILLPFDDGKKLEDYTANDFEELIEANFNQLENKMQNDLPAQFFQGMPTEMQQAYQYIANGGTDLKSLFQAMGAANEIREIKIDNEAGQIYAVRSYLQATNYGTPDEIEEEIIALQDRGDLEKKANQFKPKLDNMNQQMVNQRLAVQEQANRQRQEQSQMYMDNVYNVLAKGDVNGIKINDKIQSLLYAGLVQPNYQSGSGKQTNLLGHLLEKYQWIEPNHDLIAETLWLLADPDGYRAEIRSNGAAIATENVVRKLKTEQNNLSASTSPDEPVDTRDSRQARPSLSRPKKGFFTRT